MENKPRNTGNLVGGILLIMLGLLILAAQIFRGFDFWGRFWPLIIVGIGSMFFVGMFAGGKSVSGLAVPGSIVSSIGLMLLVQNFTGYWQSWAYSWTVIIISIGLGIIIMGWWGGNSEQRQSGWNVAKVGVVMFVLFGAFFEIIFNSSKLADYIFPSALILFGLYLLLKQSIRSLGKRSDDLPGEPPTL